MATQLAGVVARASSAANQVDPDVATAEPELAVPGLAVLGLAVLGMAVLGTAVLGLAETALVGAEPEPDPAVVAALGAVGSGAVADARQPEVANWTTRSRTQVPPRKTRGPVSGRRIPPVCRTLIVNRSKPGAVLGLRPMATLADVRRIADVRPEAGERASHDGLRRRHSSSGNR